MLGHASPATTARYDRRGERAVRQAAERVQVPYTGSGCPARSRLASHAVARRRVRRFVHRGASKSKRCFAAAARTVDCRGRPSDALLVLTLGVQTWGTDLAALQGYWAAAEALGYDRVVYATGSGRGRTTGGRCVRTADSPRADARHGLPRAPRLPGVAEPQDLGRDATTSCLS
jgi:hypothetical protein